MLLPLPVAKVRSMSLENHLALAAMRTGNGNVDQMSCLLKAVYLAYFLREATCDHCGMQAFRASEAALERSATRAQMGHKWTLPGGRPIAASGHSGGAREGPDLRVHLHPLHPAE